MIGGEGLVLPEYEREEDFTLDMMDIALVKANSLIFKSLENLIDFNSFYKIRMSIVEGLGKEEGLIANGLKSIFLRDELFLNFENKDKSIKDYAQSLSKSFNEYYLNTKTREERLELVTNLWVLLSPINLITSAAFLIFPRNKMIANVILDKLRAQLEERFGIEIEENSGPEFIHLVMPLIRFIENDERTKILVEFLAVQREQLSNQNPSLWLDLSEMITSATNDYSVSLIKDSYNFGVNEEPQITNLLAKLDNAKGNEELEDFCYQDYVDYQFSCIQKGIARFKDFLFNDNTADKDFEKIIISEIELLKNDIMLRLMLLLNSGMSIYDENSIRNKVLGAFIELAESNEQSFESLLLNSLIPIGLCANLEVESVNRDKMYIKIVKDLYRSIKNISKNSIHRDFEDRLAISLGSPLRTLVMLDLIDKNLIPIGFRVKRDLDLYEAEAVMSCEIIRREHQIYKEFLNFS